MQVIKKAFVFLSLFTILFTGMPKPEARAGIILAPTGIGIVLIVIGIVHDRLGLLILETDGADGKLEAGFASRYGHLTSNPQVFANLASMVSAKVPAEGVQEEIELKFSRLEIIRALGPAAANRALVDAVAADLQ
jgi:hypothetical protein